MSELIRTVENGDILAKAIAIQMLSEIVYFVNVSKNMDPRIQIPATADLILETYPSLKVEDFRLFCNNFKKGFYCKLYDRLDGLIIMEALNTYADERANHAEQMNINEHHNRKSEKVAPNEVNYEMLKKIGGIGKELKFNERKGVENRRKLITRKKTEGDEIIQSFHREFEEIWKNASKTNKSIGAKRFINYRGKILDQGEYVQYRITEFNALNSVGH